MLHSIRHSELVPAVLSAFIFLGMWSNAMAAVFCPHMMGSSDCCLMQKAKAHVHSCVSDSGTSANRDDMDHARMSDMNMQDMPVDMADMQMDDATSQPGYHPVCNGTRLFAPHLQARGQGVTQPHEPCRHCLIHSRSGANFPFRAAASTAYQVIAGDSATRIVNAVPSALTFVELHDHGPPGSGAPLYVLVSAFRI